MKAIDSISGGAMTRNMDKPLSESPARSIFKSLSYRVFAVLVTSLVTWAISGEARLGAAVGIADSALKIALYYSHERAWARIRIGKLETE